MSAVTGLAAEAAAFMKRAGYSSSSRSGYQRIWDQFGRYCTASGVRVPDRETAAGFCAAAGAGGAAQWQVFYRRAVGCLFDVAGTSRFALRAGRGGIPVPEIFTVEFEAYASSLAGRGLAEATVRAKTGMLRRFLAFLAGQGVQRMTALSVADVSAYVRSLTPMAASSRAGQLYFLREYLRFAVREHGADPVLGAMFPVIVFDRDAVLPSVYRPGEVAAALAEAGNQSESPLRDRAVLLLASLLGLRSGDIKGLRFDQIDWANRRLPLAQHKTGRRQEGRYRVQFPAAITQPSVPDVRGHLLSQDVILVEGGSVVNLMAVWRAHGLPQILRECWDAGVVLTGSSAGSLCWHLGGPTDSFGDSLDVLADGMGLVPYSNGVHDDLDDQPRRRIYREFVASGQLPAGYATEDGVGLHYIGTELHEAVPILPGKQVWRVEPDGNGGYTEQAVTPRLI